VAERVVGPAVVLFDEFAGSPTLENFRLEEGPMPPMPPGGHRGRVHISFLISKFVVVARLNK
jgi:hypothetical protein